MPAVAVFTKVPGARATSGTVREEFYDLTFISDGVNSNYITTGIPINAKSVGVIGIVGIHILGSALVSGAAQTVQALAVFDYKTSKFQLFGTAAGADGLTEIANTRDIATFTYRVRVVGY
jgi:hypothetical protein